MHFQIEETQGPRLVRRFVGRKVTEVPVASRPVVRYTWSLVAAAGILARSPESYGSISLARGSIAAFKRSAGGVKFAKVKEPQDA